MKLLLLCIIIVALCVFGMCFNIIFRKNGKFPDGEIAHNKALREQGIQCAKYEEVKHWGKSLFGEYSNGGVGNGKGTDDEVKCRSDASYGDTGENCFECNIDCGLSQEVKELLMGRSSKKE